MEKILNLKSTLLISLAWIILFIINKEIDIIPLFCGKGINNLNGEYYRLFTGALLHNNILHLLTNGSTLYCIGYYLEKNIGSAKFLIFGVLACTIAQLIFFIIYKNATSSIGGSSITFAFIGLIIVLQFLKPEFQRFKFGTSYGNWILIYGIVSNLPILSFMNITTVVIHFISLSVGVVLGVLFSVTIG